MYRVFGYLTKRDDMSLSAFRDYYENKHIPLVLSLAPTPLVYKRRYLDRTEGLADGGAPVDFDAMTELAFPDRDAFLAWMTKLYVEAGDKVTTDEARFIDRTRTRAYTVDEHVTAG
jgi:uncharacterized protein (TIGR02118 family)